MVDISKETIKKRVNIFIHLLKDEEIYLNNNLSSKKKWANTQYKLL